MAACVALCLACPTPGSAAEAQVPAAVPFAAFVAGFSHAQANDYIGRGSNKVASTSNFEEMRGYLTTVYAGIDVRESYSLEGQTFDCVRYDQQPAVRMQGLKSIANPPGVAPDLALPRPGGNRAGAAQNAVKFNDVSCHEGTFPLPRVTLEQLATFGSLHEFFAKGPNGAGRPPVPHSANEDNSGGHAYAYAYQYVKNYGSYAGEAVYDPAINTAAGEVFSLQQQWTIGFGTAGTQTAEIGWQVYPALYGTRNPTLFAYYTGDGYQHTGCYNYSCGAFVQYSGSTIHLQSNLSPVSVVGGAQYYFSNGYYLYQGNWWLAVQGQWVGYYPGSLYSVGGNGGLRTASTLWEVGTESVGSYIWPPEGSGQWASRGWPYASYFRTLLWRDSGNGGHYPSLTAQAPSPGCYSITHQTWGGSSWEYYFYIGGPGGYGC